MIWEALGGLGLVTIMLGFALWAFYQAGDSAGYERHRAEMTANRAGRHREGLRPATYAGRHELTEPWLQAFPDREPLEQLATTGELRAYAETGDIGSLHRETAAFFRILDLRRWTRAA